MKYLRFLTKSILAGLLAFGSLPFATPSVDAQAVQVRGIEHVGINVPDMDAAIRFFSSTFDFTPVTEMHDLPVNAAFKKLYHMHDSAQVKRLVMMRAGNGANIELFQYDSPEAAKEERYYDDAGLTHIGFYTDDIDGAVAALRARGIKVLNDPIVMTQGPTAGKSWTYFLTPWGTKLELVSYPKGEAYEKQNDGTRIWTPPAYIPEGAEVITPEQVQALAAHYLPVLNETDPNRRLTGAQSYYTSDTYFADPDGVFTGQTAPLATGLLRLSGE